METETHWKWLWEQLLFARLETIKSESLSKTWTRYVASTYTYSLHTAYLVTKVTAHVCAWNGNKYDNDYKFGVLHLLDMMQNITYV